MSAEYTIKKTKMFLIPENITKLIFYSFINAKQNAFACNITLAFCNTFMDYFFFNRVVSNYITYFRLDKETSIVCLGGIVYQVFL